MRQPLERLLAASSAEAQIGLIMTGVMLLMGTGAIVFARLLDGIGPRAFLQRIGLNRFDPVGLTLAIVMSALVFIVPAILDYEDDLRRLVEDVDWLALPAWHFQRINGFTQLSPLIGGFALAANVVCEEMWFRGYLQDKLSFLGRFSW
ncbi:MAG TPA: hypothetical protein VM386_05495, partial [Acidimicrobiales bacterium]|nr:hypothetical protein [Acidimicrobiales bacterium]